MKSIRFCNQSVFSCKKETREKTITSIQENIFNKYINLIIQALEDGTFPLGDFYKNHTISESDIVIIKKFLEEMKEYCKNKKNAP